jgi:hypothetical protein
MKRFLTASLALAFALSLSASAQSVQFARPDGQHGLNVFETTKDDTAAFNGLELEWDGAFTQQMQLLEHTTGAAEVLKDGKNVNTLTAISNGFNTATANLGLDVQLADGIRVNLTSYLSSRHHNETWVKGGYLQIDRAPMLGSKLVDKIMEFTTVRVGHFEVNYGDAHFRRTDNGNAIYNPFVGNYIMDAFTTEIGTELYFQHKGLLAMAAVTGGEIKGSVLGAEGERKPSFYGKLGFDRQVSDNLRLRLTGSAYTTESSLSNTLYGGDRAGSRYYWVMEAVGATESANFTSGLINPGFRDKVRAFVINPFVKFHGLEVFGIVEQATGRSATEVDQRTWNQYAVEALYRFLPQEQLYVGGRYNVAKGALSGSGAEVELNRLQIGGGWFVTPNVLLKAEYVKQGYDGFPSTDIRHGGQFNGFMVEGVVAF